MMLKTLKVIANLLNEVIVKVFILSTFDSIKKIYKIYKMKKVKNILVNIYFCFVLVNLHF